MQRGERERGRVMDNRYMQQIEADIDEGVGHMTDNYQYEICWGWWPSTFQRRSEGSRWTTCS